MIFDTDFKMGSRAVLQGILVSIRMICAFKNNFQKHMQSLQIRCIHFGQCQVSDLHNNKTTTIIMLHRATIITIPGAHPFDGPIFTLLHQCKSRITLLPSAARI
ncbi:hypothetical protein KIL84_009819 [Mauremys mutica]|uniref:Uncharacterized protein n=1 Tax=Mauremys mutica TaxID=74926 RepID=A0A9D3XMZ8_9SAUR|nr:hypothetical protein KIL84_009819 [Mauremys mutica]